MGQKIKQHRLKLRKSRKQFAAELGVSPKTLWGWETDRWQPSDLFRKRTGASPKLRGLRELAGQTK
jgi:DNA-binding transcriptional regulator YiaG